MMSGKLNQRLTFYAIMYIVSKFRIVFLCVKTAGIKFDFCHLEINMTVNYLVQEKFFRPIAHNIKLFERLFVQLTDLSDLKEVIYYTEYLTY
jgi:hypothetical protein